MADPKFSAAEKVKAIKRELGFRRRVYPLHVQQNKLTQAQADYQIAIFEEMQAEYEAAARGPLLL